MNDYVLETIGLSHDFATGAALDDLNLRVPRGSVFGFLGPNGAGKTTTLRLVLGLLRRQRGQIVVFGRSLDEDRIGTLRKIGSLIEMPSVYGHLTARENLRVHALLHDVSDARIDEVLELVGLASTGKKRASRFSLGMKQRLGIAIALLHSPELLILDEPTNGLDPGGILEIRELIARLTGESGLTIIVSSHLLSEIQRIATHVGILHHGSLRFQGTLAELSEKRGESTVVILRTSDDDLAAGVISRLGMRAVKTSEGVEADLPDDASVATAIRRIVGAGCDVYDARRTGDELEEIFFEMIGGRS